MKYNDVLVGLVFLVSLNEVCQNQVSQYLICVKMN